jgi:NAD(P)-dependent dehydrogenase (short-subunit alcohol dehydrogenase family)
MKVSSFFPLVVLVIAILILLFKNHNVSGHVFATTAKTANLTRINHNKIILVTGANSGIGKETAYILASLGAKVIMTCRSLSKCDAAIKDLHARNASLDLIAMEVDLSSFESVRRFSTKFNTDFEKLDVLINNAGMAYQNTITEDGIGEMMGVNHYGPFLLTNMLLKNVIAAKGRIVNVASAMYAVGKIHTEDFDMRTYTSQDWFTLNYLYGCTKLANLLFTQSLSKRLTGSGVAVNSLHPGLIATELTRGMKGGYLEYIRDFVYYAVALNENEGSQTTVHVSMSEEGGIVTGQYFDHCTPSAFYHYQLHDGTDELLWKNSIALTNLKNWDHFSELK